MPIWFGNKVSLYWMQFVFMLLATTFLFAFWVILWPNTMMFWWKQMSNIYIKWRFHWYSMLSSIYANCFGKVVNFWCLFSPFHFKLFIVMLAICLGLRFLNCSLFEEKNSTLQPKLWIFFKANHIVRNIFVLVSRYLKHMMRMLIVCSTKLSELWSDRLPCLEKTETWKKSAQLKPVAQLRLYSFVVFMNRTHGTYYAGLITLDFEP